MNAADAKPKLTEEDGYEALRGHVVDKALAARRKYGPELDAAALQRLLADREVVRFPTELAFDASLLQAGEFAWASPKGDHPSDGFTLIVHSRFEHRPEAWPYLVAYHIPTINYLDVVTNREAELYGAVLLGLEVDEYYHRLCALADELERAPLAAPEPAAHRCNCGAGGCGSR